MADPIGKCGLDLPVDRRRRHHRWRQLIKVQWSLFLFSGKGPEEQLADFAARGESCRTEYPTQLEWMNFIRLLLRAVKNCNAKY